jgi:hypothetical protein
MHAYPLVDTKSNCVLDSKLTPLMTPKDSESTDFPSLPPSLRSLVFLNHGYISVDVMSQFPTFEMDVCVRERERDG